MKPRNMSLSSYVNKLERVVENLQEKNNALEIITKVQDFIVRNDFLSAKEQTMQLMKKLQELDK